MMKKKISSSSAPKAIGPYSQAIQAGNTVYLSGQIGFDPATMQLISDDVATQARQVFLNLQQVCTAANGTLDDIVKLTIYLTDLGDFSIVNDIMASFFHEPYPARATIQISALPKAAKVEIDGVMVLSA
jgi:reactive intermediate/imine deaminase